MAKKKPRPTKTPKPGTDQKGGEQTSKKPGEKEEKAAFSQDTRKRVDSVIAEMEAELHLMWRTFNNAMGPGDFEAFRDAYVKNYVPASSAAKLEDKPERLDKDEQPVVKQLNERVTLKNQKKRR